MATAKTAMARNSTWSVATATTTATLALALALAGSGCGPQLDLGSNLIWTATHESGAFDEWTGDGAGAAQAFPTGNTIEVSPDHAHRGRYAAKLTIDATGTTVQETAELYRSGILPQEAYYSAWYYLPRTVDVVGFWVIFKFRIRHTVDDPNSSDELYDLDLTSLSGGEMTVVLYDHRSGLLPLAVTAPIVPVGTWFQVEAFYRNAPDETGRVTYWLDGQPIADVTGKPAGPNPWVQWEACSVGENLTPNTAILYVDDAAISRRRVGPTGIIGD
jgi:hypothetical protein